MTYIVLLIAVPAAILCAFVAITASSKKNR